MKYLLILLLAVSCYGQGLLLNPINRTFPAAGGANDVTHDATSEISAAYTTVSPATFTHTPSGTPKGVVVVIAQSTSVTDSTTAVTYGGVSMTRALSTSIDLTEDGRVYVYFLGASIPTGAQTVSITHDGSAAPKMAACATVTANGNTSVFATTWESSTSGTNPRVTADTGATTALRYGIIWTGNSAVGNLTSLTGQTRLQDHDFGSDLYIFERETTRSSGSFTFGWDSAQTEEIALSVIAVQ